MDNMKNEEPEESDNFMPFTGHSHVELKNVLISICECGLPIEVFDAFLHEYKKGGDLSDARFFAQCEWDC